MTLSIGSLFSGIGGLDLSLESGLASAGVHAETVWQVEQNEYASRVLARHWPNAKRYTDVRTITAATVDPVDVVCGGFPCTDISVAGKGLGLEGARSGLFFEMARIVRDLRPRIVVMENVSAITSRGLDTVLGTMAALGYDARWGGLRASEVGAPHRRERWFCVCWLADSRRQRVQLRGEPGVIRQAESSPQGSTQERERGGARSGRRGQAVGLADPLSHRSQGLQQARAAPGAAHRANRARQRGQVESCFRREPYGLSSGLDLHRWPAPPGPQHPWEPPRTRARQPHDRDRLKALGNAVVPQCGAVIGRWIGQHLIHP